jgi:hypothetical protein
MPIPVSGVKKNCTPNDNDVGTRKRPPRSAGKLITLRERPPGTAYADVGGRPSAAFADVTTSFKCGASKEKTA